MKETTMLIDIIHHNFSSTQLTMVRTTATIHRRFEYLTNGQQYVTELDNGVHKNNTLELDIMIVWMHRIVHSFDEHVIRWMGWCGCTGSSIRSTSM